MRFVLMACLVACGSNDSGPEPCTDLQARVVQSRGTCIVDKTDIPQLVGVSLRFGADCPGGTCPNGWTCDTTATSCTYIGSCTESAPNTDTCDYVQADGSRRGIVFAAPGDDTGATCVLRPCE